MIAYGNNPRVSVVLPVNNGATKLRNALDSILIQTFEDWELLVINEYGSADGSADIIHEYAAKDKRIRLIQNTKRLGLADSLNIGIKESKGEYIARMDADDLSLPERFQRQVEFLDTNLDVGICGTWQRHLGETGEWVHKPPNKSEQLATNLLFVCDLCHSTVMMRKSVLLENNLYYDRKFAAEDYELWTRALLVTKIANIPEELGKYHHYMNITKKKMGKLGTEHGEISASLINRTLGLEIPKNQRYLLNAWTNIFRQERNKSKKREMLITYAEILRKVWDANCIVLFFDKACLLNTLRMRWIWARWDLLDANEVAQTLEDVFAPVKSPMRRRIRQFLAWNTKPVARLKKILNLRRW